jgi:ribose transport system permease protein
LQQSYAGQTTVKTGLTSINMIFQPLAIYLLAQIIQKRVNIVICVPICAFILYSIFNLLTILGVPSGTLQEAFLGGFIVVFGIIGSRGVKGVVK